MSEYKPAAITDADRESADMLAEAEIAQLCADARESRERICVLEATVAGDLEESRETHAALTRECIRSKELRERADAAETERDRYKKLADEWGNNYAHFASLSSLRLRWSGRWKKLAKAYYAHWHGCAGAEASINDQRQRAELAEKHSKRWKALAQAYFKDAGISIESFDVLVRRAEAAEKECKTAEECAYDLQQSLDAAEQRVAALEAKCDLLAASLKQADARSEEEARFGRAAIATKVHLVREVREWSCSFKRTGQASQFDELAAILEAHASDAEHPDTARLADLVREVTVVVHKRLGDDAIYAVLNAYDSEPKP